MIGAKLFPSRPVQVCTLVLWKKWLLHSGENYLTFLPLLIICPGSQKVCYCLGMLIKFPPPCSFVESNCFAMVFALRVPGLCADCLQGEEKPVLIVSPCEIKTITNFITWTVRRVGLTFRLSVVLKKLRATKRPKCRSCCSCLHALNHTELFIVTTFSPRSLFCQCYFLYSEASTLFIHVFISSVS